MKLNSLRYLLKEGLRNVWSNRMMSIASIGVLISCLFITGAAVLFSVNIGSAMTTVESENSIMVYVKDTVPALTAIKEIQPAINKLPNIDSCTFIGKDEALEQYKKMFGENGSALSDLQGKENPLPNAFKVSMKDLSQYSQTVSQIKSIDGVDDTSNRSDVAKKLTDLRKLVTTAGFWIVLLLSIVSLFIISNTIRVTMFTRRLEISIMKSVGATDNFIRLPFIVEGILIGLLSGLLASILLNLLYGKIITTVSAIIPFLPIEFASVAWAVVGCFVGAGMVFGGLGSVISIGRYLKREGSGIVGW